MNDFASPDEAYPETGPNAREEIKALSDFLAGQQAVLMPSAARYATSIITRSEIHFFGISTPRFAIRYYFPGHVGFVNCRRLKLLVDYLNANPDQHWGVRDATLPAAEHNPEIARVETNPEGLSDLLAKQSAVADSFLHLPATKYPNTRYHVIYIYLKTHYGEWLAEAGEPLKGEDLPGTPYVRCIEFFGGMCAQAVCYMATALLKAHARQVHGLAEITALAHDEACKEVIVSGLEPTHIVRYFNQVGLDARMELPNAHLLGPGAKPWHTDRWHKEFRVALDAYLYSRFPVIFLTDGRILLGDRHKAKSETIYGLNGFEPDWDVIESTPMPESAPHALVLVGCESGECPRGNTLAEQPDYLQRSYLFHDPSTMPYMRATLKLLAQAGPMIQTETGRQSLNGLLMPVYPADVKMPLLCVRKNNHDSRHVQGLLGVAEDYHNLAGSDLPSVDTWAEPAEFHLAMIGDLEKTPRPSAIRGVDGHNRLPFACSLVTFCQELRHRQNWTAHHWVWVESNLTSVWLWDAEQTFETDKLKNRQQMAKYLKLVVYVTGNGFTPHWAE